MTRNERDLNTFMAIAHEVAADEARNAPTTADIRRRASALADFAQDRLASMRRAERAERTKAPSEIRTGAIRPSILARARDATLARLAVLRSAHAEMLFAHRECAGMSDEDLRSSLEDAESTLERQG